MAGQRDKNGLTPKMLAFCRAYIETGNQSEAYRRAYNTAKMKPESVTRMAVDLMADLRVSSAIRAMKGEADAVATKELGLTREWVIERLMRNANLGFDEGGKPEGPTSNKALELLGKIDTLQLFVDRSKVTIEKTFDDMTEDELDAFIAQRAGEGE